MKHSLSNGWNSFLKLFRFLAWYGIAVITIFYLLPIVGLLVEVQYDLLSNSAKFFAVIGLFLVIGAWQIMSMSDRWRNSFDGKPAI
jgi:positive regulator of sigma E activity